MPVTADNLGHWIDLVGNTYVPLDVSRIDDSPFDAGIAASIHGDIVVSDLHCTAQRADRRARDIARAQDAFAVVIFQQSGTMVITQDDRETRLSPGEIAIVDTVRPYTLIAPAPVKQLVLHCPRHQLRARLPSLRAVTAAPVSAASPTGAILCAGLASLARERHHLTPVQAEQISRHMLDMLGVALSATPEAAAADLSYHAGLLSRIDGYINQNLADVDLGPTAIAEAHQISTRQLHRLFQERGETVAGAIRERRLERCHRDLTDPAHRARSITDIAFRWGFADSAHFSRAFKSRFGLSPRRFRALDR